MKLKYEAILLDADETLFDFRRAERYALERTFADHGIPVAVDSIIDEFRKINSSVWREYETGQSTPEVIRTKRFVILLDGVGPALLRQPIDPQLVSDRYIEHLAEAAFLVEGAVELLERLHGIVPLVMVTNGLSRVQRSRFAKASVMDYFRDIVISEEVGVQKPDAGVFRIALERAAGGHVVPGRAIMIGDNLRSDVQGALDAGLDACWVNLRGRVNEDGVTPTCTVTSLAEIPPLLGV